MIADCNVHRMYQSQHKDLTYNTIVYQFAKAARSSLAMLWKTLQRRLSQFTNRRLCYVSDLCA